MKKRDESFINSFAEKKCSYKLGEMKYNNKIEIIIKNFESKVILDKEEQEI